VTISDLPALNATLNAIAAALLVGGYIMIRRGRIAAHKRFMLSAFATSALFLASYLVYHYNIGSRPFTGQGPIRVVYFTILITHVVLAAAILPMALITLNYALRARFERHVPIARWTLPVWLYVSVTGVVVYWMLYRM
jgi:putative membrane protein